MAYQILTTRFARNNGSSLSRQPVIGWDLSAPVAGFWRQGDRVYNLKPATGQPSGWVCIENGNPGKWIAIPESVG